MNIIGKLLFVIFSISSLVYPVSLDLKLASMDGGILKEAGAGQPFMAYVTVQDAQNVSNRPNLQHPLNIQVRANGYQMNMINGATTIVYQFQMRIDTPGVYTIGPATLVHESQTMQSNAISLNVTQEQKVDQIKKASATTSSNFFRLTADKQRAYVGEKITCMLTFYTNDTNVSLQAIHDPDQLEKTGFKCKSKSEPINGVTTIEGKEYRYAQWQFETYAQTSGNLVLPAFSVDFVSQTSRGMFAMLFAHHDIKRLYSNTVNLSIDPLPSGKREPSFVGTISQFQAKISPAHSHVGQGMTLTLSITGEGDFDAIPFIPLTHFNDNFKWYESKQHTQPGKDGEKTHIMEYVIQATQPGTYSIPNQELFYFDTKERTYKLIKTLEIPVHITPGTAKSRTKTSTPNSEPQEAEQPTLILHQNYEDTQQWYIPWSLYWMIIAGVALLGSACITFPYWPSLKTLRKKKNSTKYFKKQILQMAQLHKYHSLYPLFTQLCAQYTQIKSEEVTTDHINHWLCQSGLSPQLLQEWNQFYCEVTQLRFDRSDQHYNYNVLIKRALYWLDIFEKLPRGNS
jgi:hypothetical protein